MSRRRHRGEEYVVEEVVVYEDEYSDKSRLVAGLLQIFFGGLGVGRFYLGYYGYGIAMILTSLIGIGIIWGIVDGIMILTGHVEEDGEGYLLRD